MRLGRVRSSSRGGLGRARRGEEGRDWRWEGMGAGRRWGEYLEKGETVSGERDDRVRALRETGEMRRNCNAPLSNPSPRLCSSTFALSSLPVLLAPSHTLPISS